MAEIAAICTPENIRSMIDRYLRDNPDSLPAIGTWDVTQVTDMSNLFLHQGTFNEDIGDWDVSNVTHMTGMFRGCTKFRQDLRKWDTRKVVDMKRMFKNTNMPDQYKPHLATLAPPPEHGYDIILFVLMHGRTVTACPTRYNPNFANVTLLESIPCGVDNFCDTSTDPGLLVRYLDKHKDDPTLATDLQAKLRLRRQAVLKLYRSPPPEADATFIEWREATLKKPMYSWFEKQVGWSLITKGYMERVYGPDKDSAIQTIHVCHSNDGVLSRGENLAETYNIRSRTGLLHLLKDSGYGRPLIIDFSCGGFREPLEDTERQRRITVATSLGVAGGKRKRKRTVRRKK